MVLGNSMSVLLELQVDLSELSKLQRARAMIQAFSSDADASFRNATASLRGAGAAVSDAADEFGMAGRAAMATGLNMEQLSAAGLMAGEGIESGADRGSRAMARLGAVTSAVTKRIKAMTVNVQALRFAFLNMMFAGMNAIFLFGGILALSPRVRAGFMAIVDALRLIAIEAGQILGPALMDMARAIRNTDEDTRELIAQIAIAGTVIGALVSVLGVFGGFMVTIGKIVFTVATRLKFMTVFLKAGRAAAILMLQGVRMLAAGITARLIPAISSLAATIGVSTTALSAGLIAAVFIAIAAFIEFEGVRKKVAEGLAEFSQIALNTADFVSFLAETSGNGLTKALLASKRAGLKMGNALRKFVLDSALDATQAINKLISVLNRIPTVNISKVDFEEEMDLRRNIADTEQKISDINSQIDDLEKRSQQSLEVFRQNLKENKKTAEEMENSLKNLFATDENLKIGDPLKVLNTLNQDGRNALGDDTILGSLLGGDLFGGILGGNTVEDMQNLSGQAGGVTEARRVGEGFGDKNQTINNEITIRDATIEDDRDLEELARELEDKMERNQRRDKTIL